MRRNSEAVNVEMARSATGALTPADSAIDAVREQWLEPEAANVEMAMSATSAVGARLPPPISAEGVSAEEILLPQEIKDLLEATANSLCQAADPINTLSPKEKQTVSAFAQGRLAASSATGQHVFTEKQASDDEITEEELAKAESLSVHASDYIQKENEKWYDAHTHTIHTHPPHLMQATLTACLVLGVCAGA